MKIPCEIVQDMLPLYEDELCSPVSKAYIEEHLQECPKCRTQIGSINSFKEPEIHNDTRSEDRAVVRSFRKLRRRWGVSLMAMLLIIPMLLLTVNQVRGVGICYTNVDDIIRAGKYVHALEKGDFEKAAGYMNYEEIYNDILELLAMEPEDHGLKLVPVTIGEREWMAEQSFYDQYLRYEDGTSELWVYFVYNYIPQVMIPEDIWSEVIAIDPEAVYKTGEGEYIINDVTYVSFETKWGTYFTESTGVVSDCVTAADFCSVLELIPMEIYQEAEAELKRNAVNEYERIQKDFGQVAHMTLEEFESVLSTKYTAELQTFKNQGITIKSTGYERSYYYNEIDCWNIQYGIMVTQNGESYPLTIDFTVSDRGLDIGSTGILPKYSHMDTVSEVLFLHYLD